MKYLFILTILSTFLMACSFKSSNKNEAKESLEKNQIEIQSNDKDKDTDGDLINDI